jgi:predicted 3-demethylubiquinone-9 3-methyltransferase (glyoxalase superfamily)
VVAVNKITPFLWFDNNLEAAMNFYASVFEDVEISNVSRSGEGGPAPAGTVFTASFRINGQDFMGLNGGPMFKFTEAVSFFIECNDQGEIDYYWEKLTGDGGEESMCGWLKDKFGLSWQVVPSVLGQLLGSPDPEKAGRAMQAMMQMKKLDIATLQAAYDGA